MEVTRHCDPRAVETIVRRADRLTNTPAMAFCDAKQSVSTVRAYPPVAKSYVQSVLLSAQAAPLRFN